MWHCHNVNFPTIAEADSRARLGLEGGPLIRVDPEGSVRYIYK